MKIITFSLILFTLFNCEKPQPNFLFIVVDDLGYRDLSVTGSDFYETPNIDKIAQEGTLFTQGYANASVCSPSRASLLTGVYPTVHGITDWIGRGMERNGEVSDERLNYYPVNMSSISLLK